MGRDFDVMVVGAGPGGATAARLCAEAGLKTLLIEKERLPRYKACGGCLSVKTVRLLGFDLGPVIENVVFGAKFTFRMEQPLLISSQGPIGFMVMRDRFDHFLVRKAVEKGVDLLEGVKVVDVEDRGDRVVVELATGRRLGCEYVIAADGAGSRVAKSLRFGFPKHRENRLGLETEIPYAVANRFSKDEQHLVRLDFGRVPNGYGWVFPKKDGLSIGVGGIFGGGKKVDVRRFFSDFLQELDLTPKGKVEKVVGHPLPCFYDAGQEVSRGRALLVGDACFLIDPLTGEGIYYAVKSARLAVQAILQSKEEGTHPSDLYQMRMREAILQDLRWALHVSRIIYRFAKVSYRTLRQFPDLGRLCIQVLGGEATYQGFVVKVKERISDLLKGDLGAKIRKAFVSP